MWFLDSNIPPMSGPDRPGSAIPVHRVGIMDVLTNEEETEMSNLIIRETCVVLIACILAFMGIRSTPVYRNIVWHMRLWLAIQLINMRYNRAIRRIKRDSIREIKRMSKGYKSPGNHRGTFSDREDRR